MSAAVQTSEPPEGRSGSPTLSPQIAPDCVMQFSGQLMHAAHVANRVIDREGHVLPVLVLELEDCGAGHHQVVVHVPFTEADRAQAERQARALQRGQTVTVLTALSDVRLFLPGASLVAEQPH